MSKTIFCQLAVAALLCAPLPAFASDAAKPREVLAKDIASFFGIGADQGNNPTDPQPSAAKAMELSAAARLPGLPVALDPPSPSVETPLQRLFCVEYARIRSGFSIMGDAKLWWQHAASNIYSRLSRPVEEAVMVFSGSHRLKRGHVAVVTNIVSPRQIIVDQANWQNHGEIDHSTPVLDVSAHNDWSLVRVWDMRSQTFGSHVYAISGFIAKGLTHQASND